MPPVPVAEYVLTRLAAKWTLTCPHEERQYLSLGFALMQGRSESFDRPSASIVTLDPVTLRWA
jgi:hypothetical protein